MKEFDTIARFGTQITNENNETFFRHETVSHECSVNAARRAGETVETKTLSSSTQVNIEEIDSPFLSALIPLSLVVESTVRGVEGVGRANAGAPVRDGWD